jgi:hypothetical protein
MAKSLLPQSPAFENRLVLEPLENRAEEIGPKKLKTYYMEMLCSFGIRAG